MSEKNASPRIPQLSGTDARRGVAEMTHGEHMCAAWHLTRDAWAFMGRSDEAEPTFGAKHAKWSSARVEPLPLRHRGDPHSCSDRIFDSPNIFMPLLSFPLPPKLNTPICL